MASIGKVVDPPYPAAFLRRPWRRWLHRPRRRENSPSRVSQRTGPSCPGRATNINDVRVDIITLFPEICRVPLGESMMGRAQEAGALDLRVHNLRDWTSDRHHVVDDAPFGGGQGMVMKPEPSSPRRVASHGASTVVLMTPQGRRFAQSIAHTLSPKNISSSFAVITKGSTTGSSNI
jgi:tRNA-(guanine-N1)-methyltransferase